MKFDAFVIANYLRFGRFTADDTSLSRNGNQYHRYYLVEAANSVRRQIPKYSEYYTKKYQEVPKRQHKRALVLTARKFVRLVDPLLRKKPNLHAQKERQ